MAPQPQQGGTHSDAIDKHKLVFWPTEITDQHSFQFGANKRHYNIVSCGVYTFADLIEIQMNLEFVNSRKILLSLKENYVAMQLVKITKGIKYEYFFD